MSDGMLEVDRRRTTCPRLSAPAGAEESEQPSSWRGDPVTCRLADDDLVARARNRDQRAIGLLVARHNQRLFRVARAVIEDCAEAEDVVQETYLRAFTSLHLFRGDAAFSTWITRIAVNEAVGRLRRRRPTVGLEAVSKVQPDGQGDNMSSGLVRQPPDPESEAGRAQVRRLLEATIDRLPEPFRVVFVLREVEQLSTAEAADILAIRPETVKTRLFRARRMMRARLELEMAPEFANVFPFGGRRCAAMAERVLNRLRNGDRT